MSYIAERLHEHPATVMTCSPFIYTPQEGTHSYAFDYDKRAVKRGLRMRCQN